LTQKTYKTSRNFTYTYYIHKSAGQDKPALLLQHGFPDDHNLWSSVLPYLLKLPFPIIVPDLLGYNGTSKPVDTQAYNSKGMADDLAEILDSEGIKHCISIGHDWGSFMAQRVALWHPDRVVGLAMLNIAYKIPGKFDAVEANKFFEETTGLPRLAYQDFFMSTQAPDMIESHLESSLAAFHGSNEGTKNFMEDMLCHYDALEDFIRNDRRQPLKDYARDPAFKEEWLSRFKRDGMTGPLNWYRAMQSNIHWDVEMKIPQERYVLKIPVLFIGATMDPVGLSSLILGPQKAGLLPDLTIKEVESGHWQTYETPEKTGPILASWLEEREGDFSPKF